MTKFDNDIPELQEQSWLDWEEQEIFDDFWDEFYEDEEDEEPCD